MIKIKVFKDNSNLIKRYTILGHANYRPSGEDIVCSAVSILGYTVLRSLVEVCGIDEKEISYKVDEKTGYLDVTLPNVLSDSVLKDTQVLLNAFVVGVKSLIESYPKYVTLEYRGGVMDD